jgi:hypothetical protein
MYLRVLAGCRLFEAHVNTTLSEWGRIANAGEERIVGQYAFEAPTLSPDRRIASFSIEGEATLGSRAVFENSSSYLLSAFFPPEFKQQLEEGLTDPAVDSRTYWRKPMEPLARVLAAARPFGGDDQS